MTHRIIGLVASLALALALPWSAASAAPALKLSGAIFTTDSTGAPVNLNHYADKRDVYLNGGPGINAPVGAAGLPAGVYAFQVTDPSGKTLLSSDPVTCRRVTVDSSGRLHDVTPSGGCAHATAIDQEDLGITVQLFPYADTPNPGGVYKVWLTPYTALDCHAKHQRHCFVPADSKTDNFKVKATNIVEIDTRFHRDGALVDGLKATWTDTLGAHNVKYSEYDPSILAFHEAHVEAAEAGDHVITVADQAGCTIARVTDPDGTTLSPFKGKVAVPVTVAASTTTDTTYFVDVYCS